MFALLLALAVQQNVLESVTILNQQDSYPTYSVVFLKFKFSTWDVNDLLFLTLINQQTNKDYRIGAAPANLEYKSDDNTFIYFATLGDLNEEPRTEYPDGVYKISATGFSAKEKPFTDSFTLKLGEKLYCNSNDEDKRYEFHSKIKDTELQCKYLEPASGHKLMAGFKNPSGTYDYEFPATIDPADPKKVHIDFSKNTNLKPQKTFSLAILDGNNKTTFISVIDAIIYPKPVLSELELKSPGLSRVMKSSTLKFSVKITDAYQSEKGTIEYRYYKDNNLIKTLTAESLTSKGENVFEFDASLPETTKETDYTFKIQYYEDNKKIISNELVFSQAIKVNFNKLSGCHLANSESRYHANSDIPLQCDIFVEDGYELKTKIDEGQYKYRSTVSGDSVTVHLSDNTASATSITLAIVPTSGSSPVGQTQTIQVNLYGKPKFTALTLSSSTDKTRIQKSTQLGFSATITNLVTQSGTLTYSFYNNDNLVGSPQSNSISITDNNAFTFTANIPQETKSETDYTFKVQFYEIDGMKSDEFIFSETIKVNFNKLSGCQLANSESRYPANSDIPLQSCDIFVEDGYELKAKVGDYTFVVSDNTVRLTGNTASATSITLVIVPTSGSSTAVLSLPIPVNLYGTPTLTKPTLSDNVNDQRIEPQSSLSFDIEITNAVDPIHGNIECYVYKEDSSPDENSKVDCHIVKNEDEENTPDKYRIINLNVPDNADSGDYKFDVKFSEIYDISVTGTSDSFTVHTNTLSDCHLANDQETFTRGSTEQIEIQCQSLYVESNYQLYAKFSSETDYNNEINPDEANPNHITVNIDGNGPSEKKLQLAIIGNSQTHIVKSVNISITLYGVPKLENLQLSKQLDLSQVKQGSNIELTVDIKGTIDTSAGKIFYAFYEDSQEASDGQYEEASSFRQSSADNQITYAFTIKAPTLENDDTEKDFKFAVKYQENNDGPESEPIEYTNIIHVKASNINCELTNHDAVYSIDASDVKFTCTVFLEDGHIFKAKVGEKSNNYQDYNLSLTNPSDDKKTYILNLADKKLTDSQTNIAFVILAPVDEGQYEIKKQDDATVKLYGKPTIYEFQMTNPTDKSKIQKGIDIIYSLEIKNVITNTEGTLKYGLYKDGNIVGEEKSKTITSYNGAATFDLHVPDNAEQGTNYEVKAQFYQIQEQKSDLSTDSFSVHANSIQCSLSEPNTKYTVTSTIGLTCTIDFVGGYSLNAKVGAVTDNGDNYNIPVTQESGTDSNKYSINLADAGVTESQTSISIALVSYSTVGASQNIEVNLYGKPELSDLALTSDQTRIQKNSELMFKIKITKIISTDSVSINYAFIKKGETESATTFTSATDIKLVTGEDSMYTFKVQVPSTAVDAMYNVKLQIFQIQDQMSEIESTDLKVNANRIGVCSLVDQTQKYTVKSSIPFNCNDIFVEDGHEVKAMLNGVSSNFPATVNQKTVTVDLTGNTDTNIQTAVTLTITSTEIQQTISVNLYSKPTLDITTFTSSTDPIQVGSKLTFTATISNTFEVTQGKVKFALFKSNEPKETGFGSASLNEVTPTQSDNNQYTFEFTVPGIDAGEYKLRAKFVDNANQESDIVDSNSFNVKVNKLDCKLKAGSKTIFGKSDSISFTCDSMLISGSIKAKLGDNSNSADAYTITNNEWKEGKSVEYTIKLNEVTIDQVFESISFAIISGENVLVSNKVSGIHILPTPSINNLSLQGNNSQVHPNSDLSFTVNVDKSFDVMKGKIKAALIEASNTNQLNFDNLQPTENIAISSCTDSSCTFSFQVPDTTATNKYRLLAQFTDVANQASNIEKSTQEIIVYTDEDFSLECTAFDEKSKIIPVKGDLNLKCTVKYPSFVITPIVKAQVGDMYDAKASGFECAVKDITGETNMKQVTSSFQSNYKEGDQVTAALFFNNMVMKQSKVEVHLIPAPQVKSVADLQPKEYIYGQDITLKIVIGSFYNFQDAKIKYEFVENKESQFSNPVTAKSKPEPVDNSPNEFRLKIPIPESEKKGSNKYLKIEFTDAAGQIAQVYSDKFIILYHIFIESDSTKVNNEKFKHGDLIKLTLTLSNLKDDWKSLKFGYRFDKEIVQILEDKYVKPHKSDSFRNLLEDQSQSFDVSIPVPEGLTEGEEHELSVFAVNNGDEKKPISDVTTVSIKIEKSTPEKILNGGDNGKSSPPVPIIVAVVVVLLLIIVAIIVFIIIKKKKNSEKGEQEDDVEKEDAETRMNVYDDADPTNENALNIKGNSKIIEDNVFDSGSEDITADGAIQDNDAEVFI